MCLLTFGKKLKTFNKLKIKTLKNQKIQKKFKKKKKIIFGSTTHHFFNKTLPVKAGLRTVWP
jgi:hypothetical protein